MDSKWNLLDTLKRDGWNPNVLYPAPHSNKAIIHYLITEVSNSTYVGRYILAEKDPNTGEETIILDHEKQIASRSINAFHFVRNGTVAIYTVCFQYRGKHSNYPVYIFIFLDIEKKTFFYELSLSPDETPFVEIEPGILETRLYPKNAEDGKMGDIFRVNLAEAKWQSHDQFGEMMAKCHSDGRELLVRRGYELLLK